MSRPAESNSRRLLLTGANGFIGRHVGEQLVGREGVSTLVRSRKSPTDLVADLNDPESLNSAIRQAQPDTVIHLSGTTPPANPSDFYKTNTLGTLHLLDALRLLEKPVRLVLVGSAAELGPVDEANLPVSEDYPANPIEPYGLSKWLATQAALKSQPPLDVVVARVFNPIGPGLPDSQALGRFASILARAEGNQAQLTVGDLTSRRDFVDVRDIARALILLTEKGQGGRIYHLGTGRSHSVDEGLNALIERSGLSVQTTIDPDLARRRGPADSRADISRVVAEVGWTPTFSWEQSLADLWDEALLRLTGRGPGV